jgi:hypothetical protein
MGRKIASVPRAAITRRQRILPAVVGVYGNMVVGEIACLHGIFRRVFERAVDACIGAGLVGGDGFAVDASLIVVDANNLRSIRGSEWSRRLIPRLPVGP